MPNGTIVNVDAAIRPDLAVAMRGSGSQFGNSYPGNTRILD